MGSGIAEQKQVYPVKHSDAWKCRYGTKGNFFAKSQIIANFVNSEKRLKHRQNMKNAKNRRDFEVGRRGHRRRRKGWVRTKRGNKNVAFIALNDGSCVNNIQVVVDLAKIAEEELKPVTTGACIRVDGRLVASPGAGQASRCRPKKSRFTAADPESYPLQKKGHSLEFLREIAYLRPRTNTFGAVLRIRHAMAYAIHEYFNKHGFYYFHTPIITASDCEGAGAMFQVTTLDMNNLPRTGEGAVDYAQDFFGKACNLTVSGQLEGELGALSLGRIYTFGPTFRAENSNTPRHASEFWMIEPEAAFFELEDNMELAEDFLKYLIRYALDNCMEDLEFMNKMWDKGLLERLHFVLEHDFKRLDYTEGIEILKASGRKFEFPCDWGCDLQSEHERYLVEEHFKRPVILINYPKDIKAFYMKQNDDGKTVRAMDVLFPGIGEIIGGSEREADYGKLHARVAEFGMSERNSGGISIPAAGGRRPTRASAWASTACCFS